MTGSDLRNYCINVFLFNLPDKIGLIERHDRMRVTRHVSITTGEYII